MGKRRVDGGSPRAGVHPDDKECEPLRFPLDGEEIVDGFPSEARKIDSGGFGTRQWGGTSRSKLHISTLTRKGQHLKGAGLLTV
ncbi:hypothetical protein HMPREF0293_0267 [Corynebacterium glucuronolyticum ATCC 51866]|uniref:Uncharacterized protein n=1 Tax=Corynebacterium glucuronolyticum ATCC 51866 TaxID=548478 RepID=A0ABM9XSK9_9CORY|nr:hypothetical protein HMPREF0293_0267 [Corynebacterium glucuronolyticum ATCC 51866]